MRTTYIVGAGLSHYAGLPLQSEFTAKILAARDYDKGPSRSLVKHLDRFVHDVFQIQKSVDASSWPELEDIFTFIDLSANTGHHLGSKYSPKDLRRIRRALIARMIRMLHQCYAKSKNAKDPEREKLRRFLTRISGKESSFISLNWDVSLESVLQEARPELAISYGSGILRARFSNNSNIKLVSTPRSHPIPIAKMHGSTNWLYCDNCRRVYWFPAADTLNVSMQIVREEEWELIRPNKPRKEYWKCPYCPKVDLGTRIATFSYQKALDFPMFERSWTLAERKLRNSGSSSAIRCQLPTSSLSTS